MQETTMEDSKDLDKVSDLIVPWTPVKPQQPLKLYARRKSIQRTQHIDGSPNCPKETKDVEFNNSVCSSVNISPKEELEEQCVVPGDCGFVIIKGSVKSETPQDVSQDVHSKEEKKTSKEELEEKSDKSSEIPKVAKDDSEFVNGTEKKKKKSNVTQKKQRFHRPRIMEDGRKPRNPATTRLRTISKKRKKKESEKEEEVIADPKTPEKQSVPKKRKSDKTKRNMAVARTLTFEQEPVLSCLELSRKIGPDFPKGKRTGRIRRSIWKKKSKRSKRRKNMVRWAEIALSFGKLEEICHPKDNDLALQADVSMHLEASHPKDNDVPLQADVSMQIEVAKLDSQNNSDLADVPFATKDTLMTPAKSVALIQPIQSIKETFDHLIQQINYQKDHGFSSLADVSLQIEVAKLDSQKVNDLADVPFVTKDTLMRPAKSVALRRPKQRTKETFEHLVQQMNYQNDHSFSSLADVPLQIEVAKMDSWRNNDLADFPFATKEKLMRPVTLREHNKRTKESFEHLVQQMKYQKDHGLSSLADVSLHIEDRLVSSATDVAPEGSMKKAQNIAKLVKELRRLKINKRVTTLIKTGQKKKDIQPAKVDLDPETEKEWELLMVNDHPSRSYEDKETEFKWKKEREIFQSRIDLFINRMHLLQGNRKFKQWKGSVVDSVVGVYLTQNVSDYLSSNAFISVAAKFPTDATKDVKDLPYYIEEPLEVNGSVVDDQVGNNDAKRSDFINFTEESIQEIKEHEETAKRKNEKTGIMEDAQVDWKSIRRMYTKEGSRDEMYTDAVNWNAVRLSGQQVFANTIRKRGQFRILAGRIAKFLDNEAKLNGTVDLEWLRNAPSDLVKRYLLEIEGIGLKSAECVRLLGLKHSAFPVDTNVGRIAIRLGWVPLEPLPDGVQMHQLLHYPSMDLIQKYLWPRLCKLPQETLYELHYQMITFGKVFCTKVIPNCNACPMKSECKYFASAYVSSKVLLQGPEEKTESDTFSHAYDENMTSNMNIQEYDSPNGDDETGYCEPVIEFPSSPVSEIPELIDIEDTPWSSPCRSYARIPDIDVDIDALKRNVEDALLRNGKVLNSSDEQVSKALVVLTPENACIPIKLPRKIKYYNRLRTEHVVYVLPDDHELLNDFERREHDDPCPYLLAIWQPGETSHSCTPPTKKCNSDGSSICTIKTCSYCHTIREQNANTFRGTILIPCRTAMRGYFPLNGTYFQTNEVFADHDTSLKPITFSRELCEGLEKRALYCGSSVTSIFRFLDTKRIQLCFWTGFLCMRAFDRKQRIPQELVRRLHTQPGKKHMEEFDE